MSRFPFADQPIQSSPPSLPSAVGEAELRAPGSGAQALVGEDFVEIKHEGMINERALLAHWQDRIERLLQLLPELESHPHGTVILAEGLTNLWRGVVPGVVSHSNARSVCRGFLSLVGPCGCAAERIGATEDLAVERTALHNTALRIADFQATSPARTAEINWLACQRSCLKILSSTAIALGTAPCLEAVLDNSDHPLFDRALSMVKEIAYETQRLAGARSNNPDLSNEQQRVAKLRQSLVGHLAKAFLARQHHENAGIILACMNEFGSDAAPAFDYLMSGTEISRAALPKILKYAVAQPALK